MTQRGDLSMGDRLELVDLVARYAAAVDERRWADVASLFTADGVLVSPDRPRSMLPTIEARGHEPIIAALRQLEPFACTFHHLTGTVLSAGDAVTATGRTTGVAHHVEAGDSPRSWAWHVIYDDAFVPTDVGWRIARRALTIRMIESRTLVAVEAT